MTTRLNRQSSGPHRVVAAALAAGTLLFGLPALAQSAEPAEVSVHYSRAALKTDAGARTVHAQLSRAARQACGQPGSRALQNVRAVQECRQQALDRAVREIGAPMLAAVHAKETPAPRLAGADDMRASR